MSFNVPFSALFAAFVFCCVAVVNSTQTVDLHLQTLTTLVKTQAIFVKELREKLSETETKLQALSKTTGENKDGIAEITTDVSNLKTETSKATKATEDNKNGITKMTTDVNKLKQQVATGTWPAGSYCILSKGGSCPAGFTRSSGHMKAIRLFSSSSTYFTPGTFGDSKIACHGFCGWPNAKYWPADLYISACCK